MDGGGGDHIHNGCHCHTEWDMTVITTGCSRRKGSDDRRNHNNDTNKLPVVVVVVIYYFYYCIYIYIYGMTIVISITIDT